MPALTTKPAPFALEDEAGTTVPITIKYNRLDGTIPNLALAGSEVWVTFKDRVTDADPGVLQKTLSGGKVILQASADGQGVAIAYMTPAESVVTSGFQRKYFIDVKVKEGSGDEWVAGKGTLTLAQTATKTI